MPSVAELKARLKELGMSQGGDKGTLECRIAKGEESERLDLKAIGTGTPVHQLKLSKLKPLAARAGVSPIGSLDEVLFAYIEYLVQNQKSGENEDDINTDDDGDDGIDNGIDGENDALKTATVAPKSKTKSAGISARVLQLNEEDDFLGILNLGGTDVTVSSSVSVLRKAYLKLSLVLHPDKNQGDPKSTIVFQALVNAYERISQPELVEDASSNSKGSKTKKHTTIARSNEGCKRTRVRCPRCKSPWSETSVEGNPDYFYNFMMTGLRSFNCATCLFEFGCMTALHDCPFCQKSFEYHPKDFHRKITCGRDGSCSKKTFGFRMFHCSDRVMTNLKIDVRSKREKRAMITEQKKRRAESARRRNRGADPTTNDESTFLLGLANECPRCGLSLADLEDADEIDHLRNCQDEAQISKHQRRRQALQAQTHSNQQKLELQEDVAAKAAWDLLGASTDNMWMLTDGALKAECKEQGVDSINGNAEGGGKGLESHEMIANLVKKKRDTKNKNRSNVLTKYDADNTATSAKVTTESLPENLHTMTESQLRAVAASHGIKVSRKSRKIDIIKLLQSEQEKNSTSSTNGSSEALMLTDGKRKTAGGSSKGSQRQRRRIEFESASESDGSGSESEYEP